MPNYEGNPAIKEYGRATRFGAGNCPHAAQQRASRPWSIRMAVEQLCAAEFDVIGGSNSLSMGISMDDLLDVFRNRGGVTGAQRVAAELVYAALCGNTTAMQRIEDMIDGKQ